MIKAVTIPEAEQVLHFFALMAQDEFYRHYTIAMFEEEFAKPIHAGQTIFFGDTETQKIVGGLTYAWLSPETEQHFMETRELKSLNDGTNFWVMDLITTKGLSSTRVTRIMLELLAEKPAGIAKWVRLDEQGHIKHVATCAYGKTS